MGTCRRRNRRKGLVALISELGAVCTAEALQHLDPLSLCRDEPLSRSFGGEIVCAEGFHLAEGIKIILFRMTEDSFRGRQTVKVLAEQICDFALVTEIFDAVTAEFIFARNILQ